MKKIKIIAILMVAVILSSSISQDYLAKTDNNDNFYTTQASKEYEKHPNVDNEIIRVMKESNIIGLSAAVVKNGEIIWSNGYGLANIRENKPAESDTIYRIASISKTITATALMQLWENGKFNLDDDISKYIGFAVRNPKYPEVPITFRQLMTHTSSIIDNYSYFKIINLPTDNLSRVTLGDIFQPGGKYYSLENWGNYAPGKHFSYSNFGTAITACLVEIISGEHFDTYCLNNIFKPLGMDASYNPIHIEAKDKIAALYNLAGGKPIPCCDDYPNGVENKIKSTPDIGSAFVFSPAGGVRTSVEDLSKFMIAHMNGGEYKGTRILKKDTCDIMHQMSWHGDYQYGVYIKKGLNFRINDELVNGVRLIGHRGRLYGMVGDMFYDQDTNFGVIFVSNGGIYKKSNNGYYEAENCIFDILFSNFYDKGQGDITVGGIIGGNVIYRNNRKIFMSQPSFISNGCVYISDVAAADALCLGIFTSNSGKTVKLTNGHNILIINSESSRVTLNNKSIDIGYIPVYGNQHIMLPVEVIAKLLDVNVKFNFK